MQIKVSRTVNVEFKKVEWTYLDTEDYEVSADGTHVGIISYYEPPFVTCGWRASSARLTPLGWNPKRYYPTRDAAAAALVRFAAKHGVI